MKVYGYVRSSKTDQKITINNQEEKIRAYCNLYGHDLIEIIVDQESGKSVNRVGMKRLLELTSKRKPGFSGIAIYCLSRLFRNAEEALRYTSEWEKKGIALHSVQEQLDTKSPMGKFFFTLMAAIAEMERNVIAERTSDALECKKRNGEKTGGDVPYGYKIKSYKSVIKDGKTMKVPLLERHDEELETIKTIIAMRQQGCSYQMICMELEKQGLKTKSGNSIWQPITVSRIVKRESKAV